MQANTELARAIIEAARKREESFDHGAASRADADGASIPASRFYRVSLRDACEADGVNPFISYPVYLLLSNCWNDALEWAELNK